MNKTKLEADVKRAYRQSRRKFQTPLLFKNGGIAKLRRTVGKIYQDAHRDFNEHELFIEDHHKEGYYD